MKYTLSAICLIFFQLFHFGAPGQSVVFERIVPPKNKTFSGWISSITQDKSGYIWFTSQYALYRYDGYEVVAYAHDFTDPNSLSGGNLESVYADANGTVWIGTQFAGLDRFDPTTGNFIHFKHNPDNPTSIAGDFVSSVKEDRYGNLWVGTHAGLDLLDRKTNTFKHFINKANDEHSLSCDQVRAIYEDREGGLWIGTGSPFVGETPIGGGGLNRMNKDGTFTRYLSDKSDSTSLNDNRVRAIFEDSRGVFWIGTFGDGLHTMDRSTGKFQRYPYRPDQPESLSRPYARYSDPSRKVHGTEGNGVAFITEADGDIWIGAHVGGINRYNPKTKKVTHFESGSNETSGLADPMLWSAVTTKDGSLFVGAVGSGNVYRINPSYVSLQHHSKRFPISTFYRDSTGLMWMGSGELKLTAEVKGLEDSLALKSLRKKLGIANDEWIHQIYPDRHKNVWICTRHGLIKYNGTSKNTKRYLHNANDSNSLSSDTVQTILETNDNVIWIGTAQGLDALNTKSGKIIHYRHDSEDAATLSDKSVTDLVQDHKRNLWVMTRWSYVSGTLNRLDRNTGKIKRYGQFSDLVGFAADSKTLWIASRNNLYSVDTAGTIARFTDPQTGQGMIAIQAMMVDESDNLWMNTVTGIVKINSSRDKIRRFATSSSSQATGAYQGARTFYTSEEGEIFFGVRTGYYSFFPAKLSVQDTMPPEIVFHNLQVSDGDELKKISLEQHLTSNRDLELSYRQDAFVIGFAGIHYRNPELNEHVFKLDGYDKAWHKAGEDKNAYYYNVSPGSYTFIVKASNPDGVWAERRLTIVIHPPWWRTWWAYTLYTIVGALAVAAFFRYRLQLERERQKQERKDWETAQLKALDEMKTRFFSNITHEFRTPLSLILPATEQLMKHTSSEEQRKNLSVIKRQAHQLLQLINQLLDLSKLESGKMEAVEQHGDIGTFTSQIVDSFRPSAEEKQIGLTLEVVADYAPWRFDTDKWERILNNLLSNALKFTPAKGTVGVMLTVWTRDDGYFATLVVEDSGPGIATAKLIHIFDRFYQADNSSTRAFQGTGIGLALVKELAELLKGEVQVESTQGTGSKFIVTIPIARALIAETNVIEPSVKFINAVSSQAIISNADNEQEAKLPLLLVVEDHAELREFLADTLHESYRVLKATNGREGLELTREHLPDIVLSDLMMPEMDGFELTRQIKNDINTNHIAVVMLTARSAQESKVVGLTHGADDYLTKPYHLDELKLRLRNIIDRQRKLQRYYQRQLREDGAPLPESVHDKFWSALCQAIEAKLDDAAFDVDSLAFAVAISRRTLYRKLATLTGLSPNEVIRDYRLKRAKQFLSSGYTVADTAYRVGFESPSYFSKCFKEAYKMTPSEYLQDQMAQLNK